MKIKILPKLIIIMLMGLVLSTAPSAAGLAVPPGKAAPSSCSGTNCKTNSTKGDTTLTDQELENNLRSNPILKDIQTVVDVLSAVVGVVVVAMIIVGGIQYSIAGDNSSAVTAAKKRIANALIALFAFIFMFAFIEWLIPGGIFG